MGGGPVPPPPQHSALLPEDSRFLVGDTQIGHSQLERSGYANPWPSGLLKQLLVLCSPILNTNRPGLSPGCIPWTQGPTDQPWSRARGPASLSQCCRVCQMAWQCGLSCQVTAEYLQWRGATRPTHGLPERGNNVCYCQGQGGQNAQNSGRQVKFNRP